MTNIIGSYSAVPPVFVYLNTGVTNVTGNATPYTIKFDSVYSGFSSAGYSVSTGLYTVPVTGNYLVAASFLMNNITSGANGNLSGIVIGGLGVRLAESAMTAAKDPSLLFSTCGMNIYNATAGQTISTAAQLNNGSSAVVGVAGGTSPYVTWMYIKYLG